MEEQAVTREVVLPVEREHAWELVTDPEHLRHWLADDVELEPASGGALVVELEDGSTRRGVVEQIDAPNSITFTWRPDDDSAGAGTRVELALGDEPGGTRLAVTESWLSSGPRADAAGCRAVSAWAWELRLARSVDCAARALSIA